MRTRLLIAPQSARRARHRFWFDKRGAISLLFAFSLLPILISISAAIDYSRLADARAVLQRAVDNAALSGAASYSVNAQAAQTRAVVSAVSAFCEAIAKIPGGVTLATTGTQPCVAAGQGPGPIISTQIGGYVPGTPGVYGNSNCSATNPIVAGVTCGFIVTVTAQATMPSSITSIFGLTKSISASGIAANPFLNIGNALTAIAPAGFAYNNNSVWVYPVLLDANGNPDFVTNPGAIPGLPAAGLYPADAAPSGCTSLTACGPSGTAAGVNCASGSTQAGCTAAFAPPGCTGDPTQFTCGVYTMLASTYWNSSLHACPATSPCYPNGIGNYPTIIQGIIQNPKAPPTVITATTPIGLAFSSISGGTTSFGYAYGSNGKRTQASNGCYYLDPTTYTTATQITASLNTPNPWGVDYPKITHWFYSSYLANPTPLPPTYGEILSQTHLSTNAQGQKYNTRLPTVGDNATGAFLPTPATCNAAASTNDQFFTTTYPSTGSSNANLYILVGAAGSSYIAPTNTGYRGQRFVPASTPGQQYAALSCQAYGNNVFTFYWNDMGGSSGSTDANGASDDLDYDNGNVRVACSGASFVLLIG